MADQIPLTTIESIRKVHGNKKEKQESEITCDSQGIEEGEPRDEKWKMEAGENNSNMEEIRTEKREQIENKFDSVKANEQSNGETMMVVGGMGDEDKILHGVLKKTNGGPKKTVHFEE